MAEDAPEKRKKTQVRATSEQINALRAAFRVDKILGPEEVEKLSSETGLTSTWIKSWLIRVRKKERDRDEAKKREASSDPEDEAPPPKRRRTKQHAVAQIEFPASSSEMHTPLPAPDDSYLPPAKALSPSPHTPAPAPHNSLASTAESTSDNSHRPHMSTLPGPHGYGYHFIDPRYLPLPVPTRVSQQQSYSSLRPQPSVVPARQHPSYKFRGPMLLPRPPVEDKAGSLHDPNENIDPAFQNASVHTPFPNTWGITPTSLALSINQVPSQPTVAPAPLLTPAGPNAAASRASDTTPHSSKAIHFNAPASTRSAFLIPQTQPSPKVALGEMSPFVNGHQDTPNRLFQSPFESPVTQNPINRTIPMITPSRLRSYMPEQIEQDDPKSAASSSLNTPINDQFLFSSMLNLTPNAPTASEPLEDAFDDLSVSDMEKTPLKHLSVLHQPREGSQAAMTVDEMYDRLLDESLAMSDPFQAAMGLVFMSRTGLEWKY